MKRSAPMRLTELKRTGRLERKTRLKSGRGPRATGGKPSKRFAKRRQPEFVAYIHTLPCLVRNSECFGDVVAAHAYKTRNTGAWDRGFVVPLCYGHHLEQEGRTAEFNLKYGVDLEQVAAELAA